MSIPKVISITLFVNIIIFLSLFIYAGAGGASSSDMVRYYKMEVEIKKREINRLEKSLNVMSKLVSKHYLNDIEAWRMDPDGADEEDVW